LPKFIEQREIANRNTWLRIAIYLDARGVLALKRRNQRSGTTGPRRYLRVVACRLQEPEELHSGAAKREFALVILF
jgi:hypothetical protein